MSDPSSIMCGMDGAPASERDPKDWVEDMAWHRRMFAQSRFRWAPEDPYALALIWTKGRLVYETPKHFHLLDEQIYALKAFSSQIDDTMAALLAEADQRCTTRDWGSGLELVGLTPTDVHTLRVGAQRIRGPLNREARRALRGIPLPNPFSQIWELRQMRAMYRAAEDLLEDTFCDLAVELSTGQSWHNLSQLTLCHRSGRTLQRRVEAQREERGAPGDPRREPVEQYGSSTVV